MNELENCLSQIARTKVLLESETLPNVRSKYEHSLLIWTRRATSIQQAQARRTKEAEASQLPVQG